MRFILKLAREMLRVKSPEDLKLFVFEGWGYEKFTTRAAVTEQFYNAGFKLIHNDSKITIF
jgi:hypothetical protein